MTNPMNGNLMSLVGQFKQNPMSFLIRTRLNVPQNIANDPNAIMQYLLSTGQRSQQQMNAAYQMASNLGFKK